MVEDTYVEVVAFENEISLPEKLAQQAHPEFSLDGCGRSPFPVGRPLHTLIQPASNNLPNPPRLILGLSTSVTGCRFLEVLVIFIEIFRFLPSKPQLKYIEIKGWKDICNTWILEY